MAFLRFKGPPQVRNPDTTRGKAVREGKQKIQENRVQLARK